MGSEVLERAEILIVDDVPSNLVVLGHALEKYHNVRVATSGPQAIALARRLKPDLMLLDVMMPGMSGHEVHQILRNDEDLRNVAVIFVTADTSLDSELQGLKLGAEDYITKPIVVPILLARIRNVLERHQRRQALEASLSGAEQGLWEWQTDKTEVRFNADWAVPLGYARGEMSPCVQSWQHVVHPDDLPTLQAACQAYLSGQTHQFEPEIRMRTRSDHFVWMQLHGKAADPRVQPAKLVGTYMNIHRRKQAELELRERETQLATLVESLQDVVLVLDHTGVVTMCHIPSTSGLDFLPVDLVGQLYSAALPAELVHEIHTGMLEAPGQGGSARRDIALADQGRPCFLHLTVKLLAGSDLRPTGYLAVLEDVTARRMAEEEIRTLAFYDALTKLPNRRMLCDRLRAVMGLSARGRPMGAILFLNLDNFRRLEHTLGRDIGDQLLVAVAQRLQDSVHDQHMVARQGGDEFLVLLSDMGDNQAEAANLVRRIGDQILAGIAPALRIADKEVHLTVSIGAVVFAGHQESEEELLRQAELAMHNAKTAGGNRLKFFDPEMQASVLSQVALEQAFYKGLQSGEFFLVYQPQIDQHGRCVGAEALVRWNHPEKGVLAPVHFIPLAEDTGLIVPLGHHILVMACRQLHAWQQNAATAHLSMAVNVSSRQFEQPDFVDVLELLLQTSHINPQLLKLEVTESLLLENTEVVIDKMARLRELGISLSLDDFGTGYSSLTYLKRLPLDQLKIDQSFVRSALNSSVDAAIIRAIMALGNSLGIAVIAEGVESEAEWRFLLAEGCNAFQGYHFSRPCSVEDFTRVAQQTFAPPSLSADVS